MEKISMRLQSDPDERGKRKDIHLVTSSDEVIVEADTDHPILLSDKLKEISGIQIQQEQPDFPCIWARPI